MGDVRALEVARRERQERRERLEVERNRKEEKCVVLEEGSAASAK